MTLEDLWSHFVKENEETVKAFDKPMEDDEVEGPLTCIKFLGLEADSEEMIKLPLDKKKSPKTPAILDWKTELCQ